MLLFLCVHILLGAVLLSITLLPSLSGEERVIRAYVRFSRLVGALSGQGDRRVA
jgi:hypothetical protein